jgi:hypothetical protein
VEAAVKLLEWMSTEEAGKIVGWGIEGEHYNLDSEGYPVYIPELAKSWNEDYDATVRNTGIGAWFLGTNAWYESVRLYAPDDNPETTQYLLYVKKYQPMRPECATLYAAPNTDEAAIFAALNYTEANYYSRVIFSRNDAEFERMTAEMSAQLENQGLSKYNQWIRGKWQTVKTLYNINGMSGEEAFRQSVYLKTAEQDTLMNRIIGLFLMRGIQAIRLPGILEALWLPAAPA